MGDTPSHPIIMEAENDEIEDQPRPTRDTTTRESWNPFTDEDFLSKSKTNYKAYRSLMNQHFKETGTLKPCQPDPQFPANDSSLYYSEKPYPFFLNLGWKRPKDLSSDPQLRKDGATMSDILQGQLGDCWFLASLAAVAKQESFLNQILPLGQDQRSPASSLGYYYVRFWKFGEWTSVIVNDMLPTSRGKLVFGHCTDENEFWVPIVEKAYASLHGTYEAIDGGFTLEAMEDLTGGLSIKYELGHDAHPKLFSKMMKAYKHNTFMTCTFRRTEDKHGLIALHAYTVTGAFKVASSDSTIQLVKIRNPYGDDEWNGDWSDSSDLWSSVAAAEKKRIGYAKKNEGEFFMSYEDFKNYFGNIKLCSVGARFAAGRSWNDKWCLTQTKGVWKLALGSHRSDYIIYSTNPQYYLAVTHPDDFDPKTDDPDEKGKASLTIGLMQEDKRFRRNKDSKNFYLAIDIYEVDERPSIKLGPQFFQDKSKKRFSTGKYINKREVTLSAHLAPGNYVLVPSRFYNKNEGKFLIRIFSEKNVTFEQI